ncbi:hypothetical protein K435DRAFT_772282 [Dendrothele bispora CBS 962.96]|uniref:Gas1-like protein n=1 Tax=Dendrothele bispora (strain CBS 962.96) TaxID=1314807 RepID=A0A4S8MX57_DENBC|nr:hypothetical protein K435DRAFT_772282 [Dendrothele bispora CBS 962.96]
MFAKILSAGTLFLALTTQVNAHALIAPALGVNGNGARSDVQRPSGNNACGNVNVAQTIGSSTPVQAAADGTFTTTVTNFNGGADGSRKIQTATVDATAKGTSFTGQATISTNGDAVPASTGSQQIVAKLPAGTQCTGGSTGNLCLVSFKTTAGFGNCVAVSQGAGAGAAATGAGAATGAATGAGTATGAGAAAANNGAATGAATGAAAANNGAAAAGTTGTTTTTTGNGKGRGRGRGGRGRAGTRAPRALLAELEARGEETLEVVRRGIVDWIWA